jgi:hypothetical protein
MSDLLYTYIVIENTYCKKYLQHKMTQKVEI